MQAVRFMSDVVILDESAAGTIVFRKHHTRWLERNIAPVNLMASSSFTARSAWGAADCDQ